MGKIMKKTCSFLKYLVFRPIGSGECIHCGKCIEICPRVTGTDVSAFPQILDTLRGVVTRSVKKFETREECLLCYYACPILNLRLT